MTDNYHTSPGVSWSRLKHLRESPIHYRHHLTNPVETTPAMVLGTATHLAVLEPERFESEVAVWTGGTRRGKVYDEWVAESEGKLQLREQDLPQILGMASATRNHPAAAELLRQGVAETELRWTDERSGLECRGKVDWLDLTRGILLDFKTTRSTSERALMRQVADMGYHCQMEHYRRGVEATTGVSPRVYIIAVESSAPYDVSVYELDDGVPDGALHVGGQILDDLLGRLAECVRLDEWPGRQPEVRNLCLPGWALIEPDITFGEE